MNLGRYEKSRQCPRDLGLVANHLDAPSLETVTADEGPRRRTSIETAPRNFPCVLEEEVRQEWPTGAKEAFENTQIRKTLLIPEMGPCGTVCVSTDRQLHVWAVRPDGTPPHYRSCVPVNADILAMFCVTPRADTFVALNQKLLVLAYPEEVCLFTMCYRDDVVHFGTTNLSAPIPFAPSVIGGGCHGRIFVGTKEGHVYELHYYPNHLIRSVTAMKQCFHKALSWSSPVGGKPVEKLIVDESARILMVIGERSMLALYTLGEDGMSVPIRRVSYHPPAELGQFNFVTLLTILPMDAQLCTFQGMCVFSDGKRLRIRLSHDNSLTWNTVNWAMDSTFNSTFECDSVRNQIPLWIPNGGSSSKLLDVAPASNGTSWLLCEQESEPPSTWLSVLQFLDSNPSKRMENGGLFFRKQIELKNTLLQICTKTSERRTDFTGFTENTDLISQQFDPAVTRHIVLDTEAVSVFKIRPPVDVLQEILKTDVQSKLTDHMRNFCNMYGAVEAAAMMCMVGHKVPQAAVVFGREDLFGTANYVTRVRSDPAPRQISPTDRPMASGEPLFAKSESIQTETDIEFSNAFKGCILCVRQILRPFWWKTVFHIGYDPDTRAVRTEQKLSLEGLFFNVNALKEVYGFVFSYVSQFDPRIDEKFLFTDETNQIEIHELMSLMVLIQRCAEAVTLLGVYRKREIISIVREMTETEWEALNAMTFNRLVFSPKSESPIMPFLKATLKTLKVGSVPYTQALNFFEQRVPTFWNTKDRREYEALRELESATQTERPSAPQRTFHLLNGPNKSKTYSNLNDNNHRLHT